MPQKPTYEELEHRVQELEKYLHQRDVSDNEIESLFSLSPDIIGYGNLEGYFTKISPSATKILGYSEKELFEKPFVALIHEDDVQRTMGALTEAQKGKQGTYIENRYRCKDGSYRWVGWHVLSAVDENKFITIGRDITDYRQAQALLTDSNQQLDGLNQQLRATGDNLQRSNQRLTTILDSIDACIYIADMQTYEVLFINEYGRRIWGDIVGQLCWKSLQQGQDGPCAFCTNNRLVTQDGEPAGVYQWEVQNTVNGEWYECRDVAIPWIDGHLVRMEIASDITDRKRAEAMLIATNQQLKATEQQLRASNQQLKATEQQLRASNQQLKATEQQLRASNQQLKATEQQLRASNQQLEASNQQLRAKGDLLRVSEERFRRAVSAMEGGLWEWDMLTNEEYFSPRWCEIIGYAFDDPELSHTFSAWVERIHPDDVERVKACLKNHIEKSEKYDVDYRHRHRSGEYRWQNSKGQAVFDETGKPVKMVGCIVDITEQKKAETLLKESQNKYQDLFNNAPDMYVSVDAKTSVIIECNQTLATNLGYAKDEIIGLPIFDMYHPDSLENAKREFRNFVNTGKIDNAELQLKRRDGTKIDVMLNAGAVYDENGDVLYSRSAWRDISELKRMEKEKVNLEGRLRQAQKLESIGNLAGGIAHDFNNILASIIGFTELALDETPKDTMVEDSLQEVYSAGKRAKKLVQQILAFARQSDEKRTPLQPSIIAKEVLKFIRSTIPTTIEIRHNLDSDSWIMGNATQVHQILMNLCTNAAHSMEDSGGVLTVSMKDLSFDKEASPVNMKAGDYVEIKVSDTGSGIVPENIDLIFEPYFTTKGVGEGTGMGLAMVQGVIESYDGKISVASQLGKGTTFTIYIPLTKKRSSHKAYVPEQLPTGPEHILFVDDEAPIAKMGCQILEHLGYTVTTRTSSIEALELFRTKPHDFDLVVTDMTMPNLTGDKLAAELMKIRPDIPVILCTGYSKKISDATASEIGIKAFAYKPVVKTDLAKTVRNVLDADKG